MTLCDERNGFKVGASRPLVSIGFMLRCGLCGLGGDPAALEREPADHLDEDTGWCAKRGGVAVGA